MDNEKFTLNDLKEMVEKTIEKYGENSEIRVSGLYGSDGGIFSIYKSVNGELFIETDICTG